MELIAGFSVVLYDDPDPNMPPATEPTKRGERFKHLLRDCLPHDPAIEPPQQTFIGVLYRFARNPLTHALGLRQPTEPEIFIAKKALTPQQIEELEASQRRPGWVGPTLAQTGPNEYRLSVPALYWGTFRLLECLMGNPAHAAYAEQEFLRQTWVP